MKLSWLAAVGALGIGTAVPSVEALSFDCQTRYGDDRTVCETCNAETANLVQDSTVPWKNQAIYKRNECERRVRAEQKLAEDEQRRQRAAEKASKREEKQRAQDAAAEVRRQSYEAAKLQREANRLRLAKEEAEQQREADALKAARARECGEDLNSIRIGMTIRRVQRCVAPLRLVGEINRKDGIVVASYQYCRSSSCLYASVIEGKIVAWNR